MAPFASTADLEARLGITLTGDEETRAGVLLELASGLIRAEAGGQAIALVADQPLTRRGTWGERLRLPQRPVVSVASVSIDGTLVPAADYYLEGDSIVRAGGWSGPGVELALVYTSGLDPVPDDVRAICLEVVSRAWTNPASVQAEQHGNEQVNFGDYRSRGGMLLTDAERALLDKAIGKQLGTVVLR